MAAPKTPVWFGKYRLLERIALGGMAEVFLAVRPGVEGFEKQLAIKRIRPNLSEEASFVRMFLHEAKLAAQLHHPNIVQIYDLGQIGGAYYIAMEHIAGRDMSRVVPKAEKLGISFPLEYALLVAATCLDGLAYAHAKKDDQGVPLDIVHRDITPENIMVSWTGNVKILDFGIAKATTQTDHTKAGEIKGKLSYMSPEQAMGQDLDARSDIFTLGVVLYEWLTGYKLFTGENEMAVLKSIVDSKIYPPSYFREEIPADIEDILMRALAKDRRKRYQTAREMQYELQQWLHEAEFTPSASHLANFMKQIFSDELETERERRGAYRRALSHTPPPLPIADSDDIPAAPKAAPVEDAPSGLMDDPRAYPPPQFPKIVDEASEPPLTAFDVDLVLIEPVPEAPRPRLVEITLEEGAWEKLEQAAQRAGVRVEEVISDLLRVHGRYL